MYYRAAGKAVCADVIPFFEDGEFRLFYLKDYRDMKNHGEGCPWCLLTTKNLVDYKDFGSVLLRGNDDEQDLYVFTGCCVKFNGEYYIFYTGHNPHLRAQGFPEQKVLMAKSKDMKTWEKVKNFVFQAPEWLEMHDFRDPFVYYDEEKKKYCMLLAGRFKNDNPIDTRGVTLIAYSNNLYDWEVQKKPFYAPDAFFTHECPDLFKMGDWWYLVFSEFTDKVSTTYRMSKSIDGPWITPEVNTFDAHAFYAAKSTTDGKRRILFGWNCIKNEEKDDAPWQWGGTIIAHEIVQEKEGTLFVKCPQEISEAYAEKISFATEKQFGKILQKQNNYTIGCNGIKSWISFGKLPINCKIEFSFKATDGIGHFGVFLRENDNGGKYYAVRFEPKFNRLAFDKIPRAESAVYIQADTERYCPIKVNVENTFRLIAEGSVLEVYINDRVAMSARMFDFKEGNWGFYTQDTCVDFSNVRLYLAKK